MDLVAEEEETPCGGGEGEGHGGLAGAEEENDVGWDDG